MASIDKNLRERFMLYPETTSQTPSSPGSRKWEEAAEKRFQIMLILQKINDGRPLLRFRDDYGLMRDALSDKEAYGINRQGPGCDTSGCVMRLPRINVFLFKSVFATSDDALHDIAIIEYTGGVYHRNPYVIFSCDSTMKWVNDGIRGCFLPTVLDNTEIPKSVDGSKARKSEGVEAAIQCIASIDAAWNDYAGSVGTEKKSFVNDMEPLTPDDIMSANKLLEPYYGPDFIAAPQAPKAVPTSPKKPSGRRGRGRPPKLLRVR